MPTLEFDGSNDYIGLRSDIDFVGSTVFIVAKTDSSDSNQQMLASISTNNQIRIEDNGVFSITASDNPWLNGAGGGVDSSYSATENTPFIFVVQGDSNIKFKLNGNSIEENAGNSFSSRDFMINVIGVRIAMNDFFDGNMAEIIIYDRILGASEVNRVVDYLNDKWGVF